MKIKLTVILSLFALVAIGQHLDTPDNIRTKKGDLIVQPITHGTVALSWNNLTIYVDPYGGAAGFEGLADPDIILITDIHGDHLDVKTLGALNLSKAKLFVPQAVMDQLPEEIKIKATVINNGGNTDYSGIDIAAIPMYNLPEDATSRHTKGRGNGYILTMGSKKVYLSGDTEDIPEMRSLKNIDVAFICMNLPYTMDINQAASAVLEFKPGIVYPYHYRGKGGLSNVEAFKKQVNDGNSKIEVRLKNWYPNQ
ncbi:MAG: MBL fold metallo-hydrolase [Flammeovirgaceae bacterium]|nr:MBL fold metallo-hydrolase [Flammeovirgaceae bacterium]